MKLMSTPRKDGFRLPAEFEFQNEGFMIWPQRPDNWRNGGKTVQKEFVKLITLLAKYQPMTMLVNESQYKNARANLPSNIRVLEMSSNDAFIRDTGPLYLKNKQGEIRCMKFNFNAWGGLLDGLYFPWDKDNEVASKLADLYHQGFYQDDFTLEGCSILTDGEGTLITTEEVVLSEGRNKGINKQIAEEKFKEFLGIEKVIWLPEGFFMDEAGGDIDNILNFVKPGEIVLSWTEDQSDPQYQISKNALEILSSVTDAKGRKLIIHKLDLPQNKVELSKDQAYGVDPINGMLPRVEGQRLTATYVNYITLNKVIIVPEFGDFNDKIAQKQLASYYPDRKVIGFAANEILTGGGGLHTIVLTMPGR